jgi:hypothetical protein
MVEKGNIYAALDPSWWTQQTSAWNTVFVSTSILFDTAGTTGCVYVSSAPIQTGGLSAGTDAPNTQLDTTIDILRLEASQRLYDMHATNITGHADLQAVFGATA